MCDGRNGESAHPEPQSENDDHYNTTKCGHACLIVSLEENLTNS